eukprot:354647-Chlamydomonas_euryale.AAC.5
MEFGAPFATLGRLACSRYGLGVGCGCVLAKCGAVRGTICYAGSFGLQRVSTRSGLECGCGVWAGRVRGHCLLRWVLQPTVGETMIGPIGKKAAWVVGRDSGGLPACPSIHASMPCLLDAMAML